MAADLGPSDKRDYYRKQIAISLASITVLTRARWLFALAAVSAAGGVGLWAWAWFG
jgi:hypothetical protein